MLALVTKLPMIPPNVVVELPVTLMAAGEEPLVLTMFPEVPVPTSLELNDVMLIVLPLRSR